MLVHDGSRNSKELGIGWISSNLIVNKYISVVVSGSLCMPRVERKLATILAADVIGFSKLMGEDETGTLETLKVCRSIIDSGIAEHRGRIFGSAGDSACRVPEPG